MRCAPRLVAWELTNRCNLKCQHCRVADAGQPAPNELSTKEALVVVDQVAEFAPLILILSGGEPLVREDLVDIIRRAHAGRLRVALASNGTLLDASAASMLKKEGVERVSLSLDGATAAVHDAQRGFSGAFDMLLAAAERLRAAGLPFQINTTVTLRNVAELPKIISIVPELGAVEHHIFMFVPTGRGQKMADASLGAERYEETLRLIARSAQTSPLRIQVTCAPHYQRVFRETGGGGEADNPHRRGGGCLAGTAFAFISAEGEVFPCGYLPIPAGDLRKTPFASLWEEAPLFLSLRDRKNLEGRCGRCEYRRLCGGCRARAYAVSERIFGEEPYCTYQPRTGARKEAEAGTVG